MMRLLLPAVAVVLSASSSAAPPQPSPPSTAQSHHEVLRNGERQVESAADCPEAWAVRPAEGGEGAEAAVSKRLGELPDGNLMLAVIRNDGKCQVPVIVRYGIGGAAEPQHQQQEYRAPATPQVWPRRY